MSNDIGGKSKMVAILHLKRLILTVFKMHACCLNLNNDFFIMFLVS